MDVNPYYLRIADDETGIRIDLDEWRWADTHRDWLRRPGYWFLMRQSDDQIMLAIQVLPGEQPYYVAKHVGRVGTSINAEIVAYGIGKKRLDGHVDRLWIMPNGMICGGDDVYNLGIKLVGQLGTAKM